MSQSALEILRTSSLPMLLQQEIERVILGGEFAPGDHINEKELAQRFGTSRGPIREALRSLEAADLVDLVPNRGVFVRRLEWTQVAELYDVRAVLFGYAGRLLAARVSDEEIARLETFVAEMDAAIAGKDSDRYVPLNFAFHEFIVRKAGNAFLAEQYLALVKQLRLYRARNLKFGDAVRVSNDEHREMVAALAARDPVWAEVTHLQHVEQGKLRLLTAVREHNPGTAGVERQGG